MIEIDGFPKMPAHRLIGHRGVPSMAPENSLVGFKLAAELGLNWVEFDVQVTQDNQLVIMHDDTLNRTTNGSGAVHELTLKQLQTFSLIYHNKVTAFAIPTLAETMILLDKYQVVANIELKLPEALTENQLAPIRTKLLNSFLAYLDLSWPKELPLVSSFDHAILIQIRKIHPALPLGFLVEAPTESIINLAKQHIPAAVHTAYQFLTSEFISLANQQNIPILTYTVNSSEKAQELLDSGVYGLFTDMSPTLLSKS